MAIAPPDERFGSPELFEKVGRQWVDYFLIHCGLRHDDAILDVGCGIGRVAIPLAGWFAGCYEGLDISRADIEWCRKQITRPNFRFQVADVYNAMYNPSGAQRPDQFRFPYGESEFDLVVLISVFTHMLPPEVEHYIGEIERVLKPGGRCVASAFLLNEGSLRRIEAGVADPRSPFGHDFGAYRANIADKPEEALAYREEVLLDLFSSHGLEPRAPDYGTWSRPPAPSRSNKDGQDVVVATKPAGRPERR